MENLPGAKLSNFLPHNPYFSHRKALIFLFESSWKKIKNDTTFVRMRSGDPP